MNLTDLFKTVALSEAINKLPAMPGRVGAMGMFDEAGIRATSVLVEQRNGRLVLVPNQSRSADAQPVGNTKRQALAISAAHLPLSATVLPEEIQDVRAFGQESVDSGLQAQAQVINDKLQDLKNSIEVTREFHRVGALRGKVLDADGSTLVDLYQHFGVTKEARNVALSSAATNVRKACLDAKRFAELKLGGTMVTGFHALCGATWFDAFIEHDKVKAAYANYAEAADRLGGDVRKGFTYGGITFEEYTASVSGQAFIPDSVAQVFPVGRGIFKLFNAPANYNEAVNTVGQAYYAKAEERRMGKGWDLEAQANPLALCLYPEALVELTAT